jgi:hypothetical protein
MRHFEFGFTPAKALRTPSSEQSLFLRPLRSLRLNSLFSPCGIAALGLVGDLNAEYSSAHNRQARPVSLPATELS